MPDLVDPWDVGVATPAVGAEVELLSFACGTAFSDGLGARGWFRGA